MEQIASNVDKAHPCISQMASRLTKKHATACCNHASQSNIDCEVGIHLQPDHQPKLGARQVIAKNI